MDAVAQKLHQAKELRRSNRKCSCLTIITIIAVLVILIIFLSIFVPRRNLSSALPSYVLLPLYSFPEHGAWSPLQTAISTHSKVNFTIILNPSDGPGANEYPQDDYIMAIQNLSMYNNVQLVGYVKTGWATRDITDIASDISKYSGWSGYPTNGSETPSIAVHGIFFDESPHVYSAEAADYIKRVNELARESIGILQNKTIIHNPGTIIDERLDDPSTDIIVVCEDSYKSYNKKKAALKELSDSRSRHSYMIHSVPAMSAHSLTSFVGSISHHAEALFITNLDKDVYKTFGSNWQEFVQVLSR